MKYTIEMEYIMSQQEDWDSKIASFYLQGKIAYYNQEFEKARKAFRVIKSKYRRNGDFCYHYGLALMKLNEPNKAKRYINKAIHLGYDDINKDEVKSLNI